MTWRVAASAALFLAAIGCTGHNQSNSAAPAGGSAATPPAAAATPGGGVEVSGRLSPGLAPGSTFMTLELRGNGEMPIKSSPAVMDQVSQTFLPAFLVAQAGQLVEFRNSDDVLHNIRVTESAEQRPIFNVATPPYGKYEYRFERPGTYTLGCDIHPTMRADILVTATPYTATTSENGSFAIADVRPGPYTLKVFAGGEPVVREVEVKSGKTDLGVIQ
jgi:plastocyanin